MSAVAPLVVVTGASAVLVEVAGTLAILVEVAGTSAVLVLLIAFCEVAGAWEVLVMTVAGFAVVVAAGAAWQRVTNKRSAIAATRCMIAVLTWFGMA